MVSSSYRRPGILQERGGWSICAGRAHCPGWAIANQYGWRWSLSQPSRHAWHFPHHRGHTSTTRAVRSPSSERCKVGGSSWQWRLALLAGHHDLGTVRKRGARFRPSSSFLPSKFIEMLHCASYFGDPFGKGASMHAPTERKIRSSSSSRTIRRPVLCR